MANKEIMALSIGQPQGGFQSISFVMWFPVAAGNAMPQPNFKSAWPDISTKDPALLSALQAGTIIEEATATVLPASLTSAQLQVILQAAWTSRNSYLAGVPPQGQYYGFYFDGTTWIKA